MHLVRNVCNATTRKDQCWCEWFPLYLCTSAVAELGQGKPTGHQETTRYLLWLWERPSSSLRVPPSRGSLAGAALSYAHTTGYWDSRHAKRSALLLPVAHSSAQAALHGGGAGGLRKGVITNKCRAQTFVCSSHTEEAHTHTCNILYGVWRQYVLNMYLCHVCMWCSVCTSHWFAD